MSAKTPSIREVNRMKKLVSVFLIGLVAALAVVVVSPAGAKKGHPAAAAKRHAVRGVVLAVGTDSVTLTGKRNTSVTVQISGDTKLVVHGHAAALSDVQVGYIAEARLSAAGPAKALHAHQPPPPGTVFHGIVQSAGSGSITLTLRNGSAVAIPVTGDTRIRVNGQAATLADVAPGFHATVVRTAVNGPAAVIHAVNPATRPVLVRGHVTDVGSGSITITLRNGAAATITVTGDTKIRVAGHAGALSDIQVGYRALVVRAGAAGPALAIAAAPPRG
jgi:hypothetical protein